MATTSLTINVVKLPNDTAVTSAGATGVVYGLKTSMIEYATACSAAQTAAYPGAATLIYAKYFRGNQQLTGTWLVTQTVAALVTAGGQDVQSVHVLRLANGTNALGSGGAGTVYLIANQYIDSVTAASATDIANYPNALTKIAKRFFSNAQQNVGDMLVTEAVATVIAAS